MAGSLNGTGSLEVVCRLIAEGDPEAAAAFARGHYPFAPVKRTGRSYTERESLQVFMRDGFIDRYTGNRLVFPGTLMILSFLLPKEFPYHQHGKMDECHMMWWELLPTVDHVEPVARGGVDRLSNWVCALMLANSAKSSWTLEELGWTLHPAGELREWDGLMGWFADYVEAHPDLLTHAYIGKWSRALQRAGTPQEEDDGSS